MKPGRVGWDAGALQIFRAGAAPVAIAALCFDLGGTLDADGLGWAERFGALLRAELPGMPEAALAAALAAGERNVMQHPRAATLGLEEMVALHVEAQLDHLGAPDPELASRLGKRFHEDTHRQLAARRPLLERLASRMPLALVSNGCGNSATLLEEAGLTHTFRCIVDSAAIGTWKPDPAILRPALAALCVAPDRVAMVGDRLDRDVAAAHGAGCRSVWVSGGRSFPAEDPLAGAVDAVIGSVDALDPEDLS